MDEIDILRERVSFTSRLRRYHRTLKWMGTLFLSIGLSGLGLAMWLLSR